MSGWCVCVSFDLVFLLVFGDYWLWNVVLKEVFGFGYSSECMMVSVLGVLCS